MIFMEGPSLVILKEELRPFAGKKIIAASGYGKIDFSRLTNHTVKSFKTWGKHLLICFSGYTLRVHFGLFGSYRINEDKKGSNPALSMRFNNGWLNCYVAHLKFIEEKLNDIYDWRLDMLSPEWNPAIVKKHLLQQPGDKQIGDLLLNPDIFSGVGNIIRNEVLYRVKIHPESLLSAIPSRQLTALIKQTHVYSLDFLRWKKQHTLKKHWQVYGKTTCPNGHEVVKKYTGTTKRRSFICTKCMIKYE